MADDEESHEVDAPAPTEAPALDDEPLQEPPAAPGPARTVPFGAFVLAVAVAVALGVLAVVGLTGPSGGDDDREVRLAAGRFAERFLSFDHETFTDWRGDVLELSTGGFAGQVEDSERGLSELVEDNQIQATATVTDVFVGDESRGAVEVVVVYDRRVSERDGTRQETNRYVQLSLVRVDGTWLVDAVIDLQIGGSVGPLAGG